MKTRKAIHVYRCKPDGISYDVIDGEIFLKKENKIKKQKIKTNESVQNNKVRKVK